jgi:hypothetical protein
MHQDEMTTREYEANKAAAFYPPVDAFFNGDTYAPPCVEVGGAQVYAYVEAGALHVGVDLETAGDAFDRYDDECVPVVVRVGGQVVFAATEADERVTHDDTVAVLTRARERASRTRRAVVYLRRRLSWM